MSNTRVSEAVARPVRTGIQMVPAGIFTELIDAFVNLNDKQYAAVFAVLTLAFAAFQNWRENATGQGWWFRHVGPQAQPVVDKPENAVVEQPRHAFVGNVPEQMSPFIVPADELPTTKAHQARHENPYDHPDFDGVQDGDFR